jgi:hypothetical protein
MAGPPRTDDNFVARQPHERAQSGPFSQRLERYLSTLYATGEDVEKQHERALEYLRRDAAEVVIAIVKASSSCESADYPRRWALVYAAARLEDEAALPYFRELVLTPIPESGHPVGHRNTATREETILRTTAVDGVARLATRGDRRAFDMLHEFLQVPSISIRRASVQAILAVDPEARDRLAELLPPEQRFLLDVKQISVSETPQVKDPTAHLRDPKARQKEAAPDLPDAGARRPRRRGPRTRDR